LRESPETTPPTPLAKRLAWFAGLWIASVVSLGAVAFALRLVFSAILRH